MQRLVVRKEPVASMRDIQAWYLDKPLDNQVAEGGFVEGWVFPKRPDADIRVELVVDDEMVWSGAPDIAAPNARDRVFADRATQYSPLARFRIPWKPLTRVAQLVFECDGRREIAVNFSIFAPAFKVQEGREGHLFLDNDTNRSVDQFTGKLLLDEAKVQGWREYSQALDAIGKHSIVRFLICPAKEEVFSDLYPHARAKITPVDQVMAAMSPEVARFPVAYLRQHRERGFSKIDTHWSDYGACMGARFYLDDVGLGWAAGHLPTRFLDHKRFGDLGGKLPDRRSGVFEVVDPQDLRLPVFRNGIDNHGRIWVFKNENAPVSETLVLFGDSYSASLSAILATVFARVVYAYTAAEILTDVLGVEAPKYVLFQTNQRFVTGVPPVNNTLAKKVRAKLDKVNMADLAQGENLDPACCYYRALVAVGADK